MAYMERTRHQRLDPSRLLPGARSVIAVAMLYAPAERAAATQGKIARYAGGRDYHDVIRPRLNTLARFIEDAAGGETRSRAAVDRKSTRLYSSHLVISYAVFCLKKKQTVNCSRL